MFPIALLRQVFDLLRLRAGPQDLPYSKPLLYRVAALSLGVDLVAASVLDGGGVSMPRFVAATLATFVLPWLLLSWRGHAPRYAQTMLALLATGIVFSLLFLPMAMWALSQGLLTPGATPTSTQALFAWLILALVVWKITVTAGIWRHALEWPMLGGVAAALGLFLLEFAFDRLLFAGAAAGG